MGAIKSVQSTAVLAALLVIVVVFIFLGRLRYVLVMMTALLVTLLANFFVMKQAGFSINLFSLGGLVVALGVILDNSIVVLENIIRLHREGQKDFALKGTNQVGSAIITATLTFLVIFLPFLFIPGLTSLLFKELVLVVAGVVVISLFIAITITPALTNWLLQKNKSTSFYGLAHIFYSIIDHIIHAYSKILRVALRVKVVVIFLSLIIFATSFLLVTRIGSEFLPKLDNGRVMVKVIMPSGTAVTETDRILAQLETKIQEIPEIESIFALSGGRVWGLATFEIANEGELDIQLVPKSRRKITTQEFIEKITPLAEKVSVPGGKICVMQGGSRVFVKPANKKWKLRLKGQKSFPSLILPKKSPKDLTRRPELGMSMFPWI